MNPLKWLTSATNKSIQIDLTWFFLLFSLVLNRFPWAKILKLAFNKRTFRITLRPSDCDEFETQLTFLLASSRASKMLWRTSVEHHMFFRWDKLYTNIYHYQAPGTRQEHVVWSSEEHGEQVVSVSGKTDINDRDQTLQNWSLFPKLDGYYFCLMPVLIFATQQCNATLCGHCAHKTRNLRILRSSCTFLPQIQLISWTAIERCTSKYLFGASSWSIWLLELIWARYGGSLDQSHARILLTQSKSQKSVSPSPPDPAKN